MIIIAKKIKVKTLKGIFLAIAFYSISCSDESGKKIGNQNVVSSPVEIELFSSTSSYRLGDSISFQSIINTDTFDVASVEIYHDDSLFGKADSFPVKGKIPTNDLKLGRHTLKISAKSSTSVQSKSVTYTLLSNVEPEIFTYKIINTYPHDLKAYTQGLFFHDNYLYEGTGQKGISGIRKVELESGSVIKKVDNDNDIFGEGICMAGDKIYQLSWTSNIGFIYNLQNFEFERNFFYNGEGWGIAYDGINFIRSDGSYKLTVHEPENFKELYHLEVYSDKKSIDNLNELEYIDGKIYANIWQEDNIAIINPSNGKVEGIIELKGLLTKSERDVRTDVLNGIAYDNIGKRLFVTGKNWPKVFEIKLIPKKSS